MTKKKVSQQKTVVKLFNEANALINALGHRGFR